MQKITLILSLLVLSLSCNAITLKDAYNQFANLPKFHKAAPTYTASGDGTFIDELPVGKYEMVYTDHEKGQQKEYYRNYAEEIAKQLPNENLILTGADTENLIYIYANPIDGDGSEMLIVADLGYQGKTYIFYCTTAQRLTEAIGRAQICFTRDHQILVYTPILGFK